MTDRLERPKAPPRKPKRKQRPWFTDPDTRASLGFYFGLVLLGGQLAGNLLAGVPFNYLFLTITGAIVLGVLFGPTFVIAFLRLVLRRDGSGDDDA